MVALTFEVAGDFAKLDEEEAETWVKRWYMNCQTSRSS